jgi:hypothetical protein
MLASLVRRTSVELYQDFTRRTAASEEEFVVDSQEAEEEDMIEFSKEMATAAKNDIKVCIRF